MVAKRLERRWCVCVCMCVCATFAGFMGEEKNAEGGVSYLSLAFVLEGGKSVVVQDVLAVAASLLRSTNNLRTERSCFRRLCTYVRICHSGTDVKRQWHRQSEQSQHAHTAMR